MATRTRTEPFGIWTLMFAALGCATFLYRGVIAFFSAEDRTLEGALFVSVGAIASVIVAHMIWQLAHESTNANDTAGFESAYPPHPDEMED